MVEIKVASMFANNSNALSWDSGDFTDANELGRALYDACTTTGMVLFVTELVIEGVTAPINVKGWSLDQVWSVVELEEEHGEVLALFLGLGIHNENDPEGWGSELLESYQGEWGSEGEWLESFHQEVFGEVDSNLVIDWEASYSYGGYGQEYSFENGHMFRTAI